MSNYFTAEYKITLPEGHRKYLDKIVEAIPTLRNLPGLSGLTALIEVKDSEHSGTHVTGPETTVVELITVLVCWTIERFEEERRAAESAQAELVDNIRTIGLYAGLLWDERLDYLRSVKADTSGEEVACRTWRASWERVCVNVRVGNYYQAKQRLEECNVTGPEGSKHGSKINDAMLFARQHLMRAQEAK